MAAGPPVGSIFLFLLLYPPHPPPLFSLAAIEPQECLHRFPLLIFTYNPGLGLSLRPGPPPWFYPAHGPGLHVCLRSGVGAGAQSCSSPVGDLGQAYCLSSFCGTPASYPKHTQPPQSIGFLSLSEQVWCLRDPELSFHLPESICFHPSCQPSFLPLLVPEWTRVFRSDRNCLLGQVWTTQIRLLDTVPWGWSYVISECFPFCAEIWYLCHSIISCFYCRPREL